MDVEAPVNPVAAPALLECVISHDLVPTIPLACCGQPMCRQCFFDHDAGTRERDVVLKCPYCRNEQTSPEGNWYVPQHRSIVAPAVPRPANPIIQRINSARAIGANEYRIGLELITDLQLALATFNAGWADITAPVGDSIRTVSDRQNNPNVLEQWQQREERYVQRELFKTRDRYLAIEQELTRVRVAFEEAGERGAFLLVIRCRRALL